MYFFSCQFRLFYSLTTHLSLLFFLSACQSSPTLSLLPFQSPPMHFPFISLCECHRFCLLLPPSLSSPLSIHPPLSFFFFFFLHLPLHPSSLSPSPLSLFHSGGWTGLSPGARQAVPRSVLFRVLASYFYLKSLSRPKQRPLYPFVLSISLSLS